MPTYDYRCPDGHTHSETRPMHETLEDPVCREPGCGKRLHRVFQSVPTHFKGGGFYSTGG